MQSDLLIPMKAITAKQNEDQINKQNEIMTSKMAALRELLKWKSVKSPLKVEASINRDSEEIMPDSLKTSNIAQFKEIRQLPSALETFGVPQDDPYKDFPGLIDAIESDPEVQSIETNNEAHCVVQQTEKKEAKEIPQPSKDKELIVIEMNENIAEKHSKKIEQLKKNKELRDEQIKKKREERGKKSTSKSPKRTNSSDNKSERKVSLPSTKNTKKEETRSAISCLNRKDNMPTYSKINNRKLIYNAVNMVLLLGEPNRKLRDLVSLKIKEYNGEFNLIILFKDSPSRHDFKGLYEYNPATEEAALYYGRKALPSTIKSEMIDSYYHYDSGNKDFKAIIGNKNLSTSVDAVSLTLALAKQWKLA